MRAYDCTADCLVDNVLLHHYVKAKNERQAWLKGYIYFNYHCSVADGGTVDCKRVTDYSKIRGLEL
jgi:hypothetical protein